MDCRAQETTLTARSPDLRVSDAERDQVAGVLREHAAAGRLGVDELAERLDRAYAARTGADLDALVADLPDVERRHRQARAAFRVHLGWFVAVNAMLVAIWALSGFGPFWPAWPLLGWGIGLFAHGRCRPRGGFAARPYGSTRPRRIA